MNKLLLVLVLMFAGTSSFCADAKPAGDPVTLPAVTAPNGQTLTIQVVGTSPAPAGTTAVTVTPTDPEPSLWSKILMTALVAIGTLFTTATAAFFKWLTNKVAQNDAQKAAIDALHAGVDQTYLTLYQQFKDDAEDGKISAGEAAQLRQNAMNQAMTLAKGPGLDALKAMAVPMIESIIQRIVSAKKAQGAVPSVVLGNVATPTPIAGPIPTT